MPCFYFFKGRNTSTNPKQNLKLLNQLVYHQNSNNQTNKQTRYKHTTETLQVTSLKKELVKLETCKNSQ